MKLIEVKKGKRAQFINHEHDYFLEAFLVNESKDISKIEYKILFNGQLIGRYETYALFSKKCRDLVKEWNLQKF